MILSELTRLAETLDNKITSTLRGIPAFLLNGQEEKAKEESEKYLKLRSLHGYLMSGELTEEIIQKIKMEMF
jgi:hypothetical protein